MELRERHKVLIDTETTGYDKEKHQLIEVAMIILDGDRIVDTLEIDIKHKEYTITTGAMASNKIDLIGHEEIAVDPKQACEIILDFLGRNKVQDEGFIVLGQNVQFDIGFLEKLFLSQWKIKELRELVSYRTIDIMQLAIIRNLEGKISLEKQSLDYLLTALDIEIPEDRHRALRDCYLELEVYKKLLSL